MPEFRHIVLQHVLVNNADPAAEMQAVGSSGFTIPSVVVFLALQQRLVGGQSAGAIQ